MSEEASIPSQICPSCGAALDVAQVEPLTAVNCPTCEATVVVGKTLGPYELVEVMGRGGMGVVYRAIDHQLDRQVALKVLRNDYSNDEEFIRKLDEEAAITGGINHPHVVKVYTTGTAEGRFFIAMELVDKGTLDDLMEVQGRIAESQALEIASQIAQGLRAASQIGLIHRDVKPGNILFADAHSAKISDFGLAMLEEASKGSDEIWGTPYYVSPERLDRKPEDFRSDIYSLGATIFHAIAGRPPFEAADAGLVALKHLKSQAVSLQAFAPWVAGSTAFVINRMLMKEPSARYDSYDELVEHLEYARAELAQKGSEPAQKQRVVLETAEDRKRWGQLTFGVLGLLLLLGLAAGAYFLFFAKETFTGSAVSRSVGADNKHSARFDAARKALLGNRPADAAQAFHALATDPTTPGPLIQWSLVHQALAEELTGHWPAAQRAIAGLSEKGALTSGATPEPRQLFFQKLSSMMADPKPTPASALSSFNLSSFGAIAPLLIGLKDWELSDFENANNALRAYQSAAPTGEFAWMTDYRPLIEDYLADLSAYRGATLIFKSAKTSQELQKAAAALLKGRAELRRKATPLSIKMEAAAQEATTLAVEKQKAAEETVKKEKAAFGSARDKAVGLAKEWKFKEARSAVSSVVLTTDLQKEQRALVKKLDWLQRFKETLVKDLAKGYHEEVKGKDGTSFPNPVTKASDRGLELGAPDVPTVNKGWRDVAPESVLAMAQSFLAESLPAPAAAERRWEAGIFALFTEQRPAARQLLLDAAKGQKDLTDLLPLLIPKKPNIKGKPPTGDPYGDPVKDLFAAPPPGAPEVKK